MRHSLWWLIVLVLAACSGKPPEEPEPDRGLKLTGRVASVQESDGFALIEGLGNRAPASGTLITTIGQGRTATLVVTGEADGRYAAADIKGGVVKTGDAAYERPARDKETGKEPAPGEEAASDEPQEISATPPMPQGAE